MADKKITIHPIDNGEPDYATNLYPKTTVDQVNGLTGALAGKQDMLTTSSVNDGTLTTNIGFDCNGNLVKGSGGSGGVTITFVDWTVDGYDVTISFTNGASTGSWVWTKIYDNYTVNNGKLYLNSSNEIGSISTVNGSTTVHTTTGKLFVYGRGEDPTQSCGTITCSSNISNTGKRSCYDYTGDLATVDGYIYMDNVETVVNYGGCLLYSFSISDNGTITINGADWYD